MEWTVVTALVVVVGLFATVGTPILKLNKNIVELNMTMKAQNERMDRIERAQTDMENHDHESHKRLWVHNTKQDEQLSEHERRIGILEQK